MSSRVSVSEKSNRRSIRQIKEVSVVVSNTKQLHSNKLASIFKMDSIRNILKFEKKGVKTKKNGKKGGQQFSAQKLFLVLFFGEWKKVFPAKTILVRDLSQS